MASVTGSDIGQNALVILNVLMPGQALPGPQGEFALGVLNRMLKSWASRRLMVPLVARELFNMTANKGSPTNPYTIGSGGDLDTARPPNQASIEAANLVLTDTDPEVRVPLGIFTTDAYAANRIPAMTSEQPTSLFYNPTYASNLGSVYLWPVPDNATNDLELFLRKSIAQFADLSTTYYVPDEAEDAITYQLARRLAGPMGRTMTADDKQIAIEALATFKRSTVQLSDLANDARWANARGTLYNIESGQGG